MTTFQQTFVSHCLLSYAAVECRYSSLATFCCHPSSALNASSQPSWVAFDCHQLFLAAIVCPGPILLASGACRAILVVTLCHRASLAVIFCNRAVLTVTVPRGSSFSAIASRHFSFVASDGPLSCLATRRSLGSLDVIHESEDSRPIMARRNNTATWKPMQCS